MGKELTAVSAKLTLFVNLRVLNLSGNKLSVLPDEMGQLSKLEHLGLNEVRAWGHCLLTWRCLVVSRHCKVLFAYAHVCSFFVPSAARAVSYPD